MASKSKTGNRKYTAAEWKKWKRAQRAYKAKPGEVRHHTKGGHVVVMSRKGHATRHKKSGTQGGRGRKNRAKN